MNYSQLWRSRGLALSLLLSALTPSSMALAGSHSVRKGETFTSIARQYRVSVGNLQKANPTVNPGIIQPGQVISLPSSAKSVTGSAPSRKSAGPAATAKSPDVRRALGPASKSRSSAISTYEVQSGDTLSRLARRSSISIADLVEMNDLQSTALNIGQKLIVPADGKPRPETAPAEKEEHTVDLTPPSRRSGREETPPRPSAPAVNPPAAQGTYYHVVERGETFSSIARDRRVTVAELIRANPSVDPAKLRISQKINVPGVQIASLEPLNRTLDTAPGARPASYQYDSGAEAGSFEESGESPAVTPPDGTTRLAYRISGRDSMDGIAKKFSTTPAELRRMNHMGPFDILTIDQFLVVPWEGSGNR